MVLNGRMIVNGGDVVLDPFCGGGTTLVEALAAGRIAAGSDISELAVYLARAKTTPLSKKQLDKVGSWVAETAVSTKELLGAHPESRDERLVNVPSHSRNLVAELRTRAARLPRGHCQTFATCLLLKVFQWAYDGKEARPNPAQIVARLQTAFAEMRAGMMQFTTAIAAAGLEHADVLRSRFLRVGAAHSLTPSALGLDRPPVSLVVTSPPYLGVHVLYNRWQLQGRRELKVPFFLTGCKDIGGPAAYTIVARASVNFRE